MFSTYFYLYAVVALLLLGAGAAVILRRNHPVLEKCLLALMGLCFALTVVGVGICWTPPESPEAKPDYAVVLGAGLVDGEPGTHLISRLEAALDFHQQYPDVPLFVSGGEYGGVTQAAAMAQWLMGKGVEREAIIEEDLSRTTAENLLLCKSLARFMGLETDTVAIISNEYHLTRASVLASQLGQTAVCISAPTPTLHARLACTVRETFSFVKVWLLQQ